MTDAAAEAAATQEAATEAAATAAFERLIGFGDRSFRALATAPWLMAIEGEGHIECVTSGSSGAPKIIRRTRASWLRSFAVNRDLFAITPADSIAVFGVLGHSLALYGVMEGLALGLRVHSLAGLRPDRQAARLSEAGVTILYATPTQLRMMRGRPVASVRLVLCGGGFLDRATRDHVSILFPRAELRAFYGASETSFITLTDSATPEGAVGRAYPGVEIEIRNALEGTGGESVGEVWVRSPYLFEGYALGDSASTRREGGFLTVGELGRIDPQGHLWLMGRRDRMVTIADRNVYPEAVERILAQYLAGRGVAVIAVPDPLRGHSLCAFVEAAGPGPLPDEALPDEADLRAAVAQALGAHMVPRRIAVLDRFPLLASGKPDLRALAQAAT